MEVCQSAAPADSQNQLQAWEHAILDIKSVDPNQQLSNYVHRRGPKGEPPSRVSSTHRTMNNNNTLLF